MAHLLRQRTVSLLGLLAGCAVLPAAVVHFFGETEVQIPGRRPLPADRHQRRARGRRGARAHACRRPARRRACGADRHGVLVDGRPAVDPRPHHTGLPRRRQRAGGLLGRADPAGGRCGACALRDPRAAATERRAAGARCFRALCSRRSSPSASWASSSRRSCRACPRRAAPPPTSCSASASSSTRALAVRAGRTFLLTRRFADLAVVYGLVLLAVALVPGLLMEYDELGWWLGHAWELIGIGLVGVPVALDLHRGAQSRPLVGDLRASELVSAADAFMGPTVRALLVRLAHKDDYTAAHTRGVALRAVQVGEELGLPPARLRELAIGGLVHDVGKLPCRTRSFRSRARSRTRSTTRSSGIPGSAATSFASWASPRTWLASSSTITSGSTGAATRAGSARRISTSRRASSRCATSSTLCSRGGSTARLDAREGARAAQQGVRDGVRLGLRRGPGARDRARAGRGRQRGRCLSETVVRLGP